MIKLDQHESSLYYFIKGWYQEINFWDGLEILYKDYYGYDFNREGMYYFVRRIWIKLLEQWHDKDVFLTKYDNLTLPSNNWQTRNQPGEAFKKVSYNDVELMESRIAAMCSQIRCAEAKYFEPMPIQQVGELMPKKT